jgi:hypothetical protein
MQTLITADAIATRVQEMAVEAAVAGEVEDLRPFEERALEIGERRILNDFEPDLGSRLVVRHAGRIGCWLATGGCDLGRGGGVSDEQPVETAELFRARMSARYVR